MSRYQPLPVEMLKIAQNPTIKIPIVSIATARSAGVGPRISRNRHIAKLTIRIKKQRDKKGDCQSNKDVIGDALATNNATSNARINNPEIIFLEVSILLKNPF